MNMQSINCNTLVERRRKAQQGIEGRVSSLRSANEKVSFGVSDEWSLSLIRAATYDDLPISCPGAKYSFLSDKFTRFIEDVRVCLC